MCPPRRPAAQTQAEQTAGPNLDGTTSQSCRVSSHRSTPPHSPGRRPDAGPPSVVPQDCNTTASQTVTLHRLTVQVRRPHRTSPQTLPQVRIGAVPQTCIAVRPAIPPLPAPHLLRSDAVPGEFLSVPVHTCGTHMRPHVYWYKFGIEATGGLSNCTKWPLLQVTGVL